MITQQLKRFSLQSLVVRRALSTAIAIFIAVLADNYYSLLNEFWTPLTTILLMQMTIRINLRTALLRFMVIVLSVILGSFIFLAIKDKIIVDLVVIIIFVAGCCWHNLKMAKWNGFSYPLIVAIVLLMMLAPYSSAHILYARVHDVALGGVIGIVCGMLIFPGRADVDFRRGVIPVLQSYVAYLAAITQLLFREQDAEKKALDKKQQVEKVLQTQEAFFPEWVYEPGFNPALRSGHRHFLIRVEQVGQILFKMHHVARYAIDSQLLEELHQPIVQSVDEIKRLILAVIAVLDLKKPESPVSDLQDEIAALEKAFKEAIPLPLELLDMSKDNVHLASFIYDIKDLQKMLLKLAEALK